MEDTLPKLLARNARDFDPRKIAIREKNFGIWQGCSWREFQEIVETFALGLAALGLKRGDKLAIIGDNRPQWLAAELAGQALGAVSVGIYQDAVAEEVASILAHCDVKLIVVEDQEQVDKVLDVKASLPELSKIVYWDPKGMRNYRDEMLLGFEDVQKLGREHRERDPQCFGRERELGSGDDVAMIVHTSGTSGVPKGAVLSHRNLVATAERFLSVDPIQSTDAVISHLPLAWAGEQLNVVLFLVAGFTMHFPEEPETIGENIREVGPHSFLGSAPIWENLVSSIQVRLGESSGLKRWLCRRLMPVGYRVAQDKFDGKSPAMGRRALRAVGELLVYGPIRDHIGLGRVRHAYNAGSALSPEVFHFMHALGINLKQLYGQTENLMVVAMHRDGDIRLDTVGTSLPDVEVDVADSGELTLYAPSFLGYYKDQAATTAVLEDALLHTNDAGFVDERGHVVMIDRLADVIVLPDGGKLSPLFVENKLRFSPYIRQAVVIGRDRPYLGALVNVDAGNVGKWAEGRRLSYTSYADLVLKPEVNELILKEVRRVNADLPKEGRVRKLLLLHKELDADDGELTRTRKVRRTVVEQRYSALIDALYDGSDHVVVEAATQPREGRETRVEVRLPIAVVEPEREPKRIGVA